MAMLDAFFLVAKERERQLVEEGWDPDHDDEHEHGQLALAAAAYAIHAARGSLPPDLYERLWPFDQHWWKPKGRVRDLVRAAALLLAEIERVQREEQGL